MSKILKDGFMKFQIPLPLPSSNQKTYLAAMIDQFLTRSAGKLGSISILIEQVTINYPFDIGILLFIYLFNVSVRINVSVKFWQVKHVPKKLSINFSPGSQFKLDILAKEISPRGWWNGIFSVGANFSNMYFF